MFRVGGSCNFPILCAHVLELIDFTYEKKNVIMNPLLSMHFNSLLTTVGPDQIKYHILKHLPRKRNVFCKYTIKFGKEVISLCPGHWQQLYQFQLKPGKDNTDPNNYRPIFLTSCICKTMKRMINKQRRSMSLKSSYTSNGDKCRKLQMECRRYMAEILPIRRKLFNQSIHQMQCR